jgi:hypothetical protein
MKLISGQLIHLPELQHQETKWRLCHTISMATAQNDSSTSLESGNAVNLHVLHMPLSLTVCPHRKRYFSAQYVGMEAAEKLN